jgi:MOSC domain-containing protein YiiM
MKIAGIAIGQIETVLYRGKNVKTGIYKQPLEGPIQVGPQGLEGDHQVDLKNHGGTDKAVYAYSLENLAFWAAERGDGPYLPGHVGENLTIQGLDDHDVAIGDRFRAGETLMEVTQPRVPCFKLGIRMQDHRFVETFLQSGRTGFYLRVIQPGRIQGGDAFEKIIEDPKAVSIPNAMKALLKGPDQLHWIQRVLEVPALSAAWREDLEARALKFAQEGQPHET